MFRDGLRVKVWDQIRQRHLPAFNRLLTREVVIEAARLAGVAVGDSPLSVLMLPWLAVSAALHVGKSFAEVLVVALKILSDQPGWEKSPLGRQCAVPRHCQGKKRGQRGKKGKQPVQKNKHDPRGNWLGSVTEEAFTQARKRLPLSFWAWLLIVLAQRLEAAYPQADRWNEFRLLMLDGTHVPLARWKGLIDYFGTAKNGKKKAHQRPQARMVMLALAQTRTPWRYEITPWSTHEQAIAHRLLVGLRANDLVLMDRGFWSYALFWQIAQQHAFFAIRLRSNIPLKTVKRLGSGDRLVTWRPCRKSRRKGLVSWEGLPREITLRVVDYQIRGFRKTAVVTNVLDPKRVARHRLGSAGWLRRRRPGDRGGAVSSPLGNRNPVLRVEDPPRNGPRPAGADARLDPLRNCRACVALPVNALVDGRGGRSAPSRSGGIELRRGAAGTGGHASHAADGHPATNPPYPAAATARTNRTTPHPLPTRPTLPANPREVQNREIPQTN